MLNYEADTEALRKVAERGGFEPPIQFYPYNGLAIRYGTFLTFAKLRLDTGNQSLLAERNYTTPEENRRVP
jgi:hypothetical protein